MAKVIKEKVGQVKPKAVVDGVEKPAKLLKPSVTRTDTVSGLQVLDLNKLEPAVRDEVSSLMASIVKSFTEVRVGYMKIGKDLFQASHLLQARGQFVAFLNGFPGFKQAQAYRYINAYKLATKYYPPAVLDAVLTTGIDLIGTDSRPYGKYEEVVKQLPPPKGDDMGKALDWLNRVQATYSETRKGTANRLGSSPLELQKKCFATVTASYRKVKRNNVVWLRDLFGYILSDCGLVQEETITPKQVPATMKKEKVEKVVEKEDESDGDE